MKKQENPNNPFPIYWHLNIDDLMDELKTGKRKEIKDPEMTWAREYERSLIPENYRFPKKGNLYAAKFDQDVDFITCWSAPYTGGGVTKLFKDEQLWVDSKPLEEKPIGTYLLAVNYVELEKRVVTENDRNEFKYDGFYFHISTMILNESFNLLKTNFDKDKFS